MYASACDSQPGTSRMAPHHACLKLCDHAGPVASMWASDMRNSPAGARPLVATMMDSVARAGQLARDTTHNLFTMSSLFSPGVPGSSPLPGVVFMLLQLIMLCPQLQ